MLSWDQKSISLNEFFLLWKFTPSALIHFSFYLKGIILRSNPLLKWLQVADMELQMKRLQQDVLKFEANWEMKEQVVYLACD